MLIGRAMVRQSNVLVVANVTASSEDLMAALARPNQRWATGFALLVPCHAHRLRRAGLLRRGGRFVEGVASSRGLLRRGACFVEGPASSRGRLRRTAGALDVAAGPGAQSPGVGPLLAPFAVLDRAEEHERRRRGRL